MQKKNRSSWKRSWFIILESLFGILIILSILGICFFLMYWGFNQIYKTILKPKKSNDAELVKDLDTLKKRVEILERKFDNKEK